MRISLSTGALYGLPLEAVCRLAAEAGFESLELVVAPEVVVRGPGRVRALVADHGLEIAAVHPPLVWIPGWRERRGGLCRAVGLARALGAPRVVAHPPRRCADPGDAQARRFRRRIEEARHAAGADVRIALENLGRKRRADDRNPFTDLAVLVRFAREYDLGLTLDTSHAASFGHDLLDAAAQFGPRLENVHLSDYRPGSALVDNGLLRNHFVHHQVPGTGVLPLAALLARLLADRYAGNISVEVGPVPMRAWWLPRLRRELKGMAAFVRGAGGQVRSGS
ncbi:MAG: sugar phosphate isomerase/epimerase [Planctomycetes bacterium]|nr:sugar phosphate isomerase/epimerase [Planctomycetota bacterium]